VPYIAIGLFVLGDKMPKEIQSLIDDFRGHAEEAENEIEDANQKLHVATLKLADLQLRIKWLERAKKRLA